MPLNCYYSKLEGHFQMEMKLALLEEEGLIKLPVRSDFTPLDNIYIENPP